MKNKETLEEAAERRYGTDMDSIRGSTVYDLNTDLKRGFIEGIEWAQERMYSEEEVLVMLLIKHDGLNPDYVLEQFKKIKNGKRNT